MIHYQWYRGAVGNTTTVMLKVWTQDVGPSANQERGGESPGGEGLPADTRALDSSPGQTVT